MSYHLVNPIVGLSGITVKQSVISYVTILSSAACTNVAIHPQQFTRAFP